MVIHDDIFHNGNLFMHPNEQRLAQDKNVAFRSRDQHRDAIATKSIELEIAFSTESGK
jgi:hypothetical protein